MPLHEHLVPSLDGKKPLLDSYATVGWIRHSSRAPPGRVRPGCPPGRYAGSPDYESEIDIEVFNDSSQRVVFTTYAGGRPDHTETVPLPFDPTPGFHEYGFDYAPGSVTFYVDGRPMRTWDNGVPRSPTPRSATRSRSWTRRPCSTGCRSRAMAPNRFR